jgi:hypothetical protein
VQDEEHDARLFGTPLNQAFGDKRRRVVAFNMKKTEHAGAKKGRGAYYGLKRDAKRESNKGRREQDARAISESLEMGCNVGKDIAVT